MQTDGDKWELKTWNEKVIKTELSGRSALKGQRSGLGCFGIEGRGGGGGGGGGEEEKRRRRKRRRRRRLRRI